MIIIKKYSPLFIEPDLKSVLGRLGYNPSKSIIDNQIISTISNELIYTRKLIKPVGYSIDLNIINKENNTITFENDLIIQSSNLSKLLQNSIFVSILVCTIGDTITKEINKLTENNDLSRAIIIDAIASEAVDFLADYINKLLEKEKSLHGFHPTRRYSPGYGDLSLSVHKDILPLLNANEINVTFNPENFILYPEKTITAFIGWERN